MAAWGLFVALSTCPFALFTGVPCPGCGMSRALFALLHGDLNGAFHLHPLSPVVALVITGAALTFVGPRYGFAPRRSILPSRLVSVVSACFGVVGIAVWVLRFWGWFGGPVAVY